MMRRLACIVALVMILAGLPAEAVYVRLKDLSNLPTPPNPVTVSGRVTSETPLKISDGGAEIAVDGLNAQSGDFIVVKGNWNGTVLTVTGTYSYLVGLAKVAMVFIPAGSFLMGNNGNEPYSCSQYPHECPQRWVYLSGYWIGKYEVTRGEYAQFIAAGGYSNPAHWSTAGWNWRVSNNRTEPRHWAAVQDWGTGSFTQTDRHPVVGVTYYEAEAFCNWAGGRLPTEAEREKATRWHTGTQHPRIYPWGDIWDPEKNNNWDDTNPAGGGYRKCQTAPVGSYPAGASPYGLHDVAGNVWEWVKDWYHEDYYSQTPPGGWVDPQGPTSGSFRVLRGGSWYNTADYCRSAFRYKYAPTGWSNISGFRMARSAP